MTKYEFDNLIAGQWRDSGEQRFSTRNPAQPDEAIGSYYPATPELVEEAGAAASTAQTEWSRVPAVERVGIMECFLTALQERAEEIACSITLEQGKPLAESRGETGKSLAEARAMAGHLLHAGGEVLPSARSAFRNLVTRRPRGVIAAITPWNFPILTPMRKIAPGLLHGNAIILKPSEFTPATACLIGDAGRGILPDGLLQIVQGGAEIGEKLCALPVVSGITFTGSVATGRKVYRAGATNLAELSLELGGKNAAVINDTDDLDQCLDQIAGAAFMCAGQRCTAISRVIVNADLEEPTLEGLTERARRVVLGDGMSDGITMGPLTHQAQLERVRKMVAAGVDEGAKPLIGAEKVKLQGLEDGYFYPPTILTEVVPDMSVAKEEIFGPVISVLRYRDLDEAFTILNAVEYGLTSALFSNDQRVIQRFVDESENGMIHVNHGTIPDSHMPFGGVKNSGVGAYSVGLSAVQFYTTEHSVYLKP